MNAISVGTTIIHLRRFRVHVSSQHITTRQETSHFMLYDIVAYSLKQLIREANEINGLENRV